MARVIKSFLFIAGMFLLVSACQNLPILPKETPIDPTAVFEAASQTREAEIITAQAMHNIMQTVEPTQTASVAPIPFTATADTRPLAEEWRTWLIVPEFSDFAKSVYFKGIEENATNRRIISKIGDCHSFPNVFMGIYDTQLYAFRPEDQTLQAAVDYFQGTFEKESYAVFNGATVASVLAPAWADAEFCKKDESPLDCEMRINNPSIMFINLGSNWIADVTMDSYTAYLKEIVEKLIARGVLPILSSKADDGEGGHRINAVTAQIAREYDLPFYNFWRAAQSLPNGGIDTQNDEVHLSVDAWDTRNYYALKTIWQIGNQVGLF